MSVLEKALASINSPMNNSIELSLKMVKASQTNEPQIFTVSLNFYY